MKLEKYCISDEEYYENTTFISYVITRDCDADCWYCHWNGVEKRPTDNIRFDKILEFIDAQELPNVHFTFYGGEPTQHPKLLSYMKTLNEKYDNLQIVLITNLLKSKRFFEKVANIPNLKVVASYHDEIVSDLDEWLEKVDLLPDVHVRLMMTKQNYTDTLNLHERLKRDYKTHIKPIEQLEIVCTADDDPETPLSDIEIIEYDGYVNEDFYLKFNNFKHMMCSSGFVVRENGDLLKCWEDINGTVLMNLFNEPVRKAEKWHLCTHSRCTCGHRFPKVSLRQYGKLYKEKQT